MLRFSIFCLVLLSALTFIPSLDAQQTLPSCEEQLAETLATLSFVRSSRQVTEDTAGRVTATLQKRLETNVKELDKLQHPAPPIKEPSSSEPSQKDGAS